MTRDHNYREGLENVRPKPLRIGAGAVVTADVVPYAVIPGVPARKIEA